MGSTSTNANIGATVPSARFVKSDLFLRMNLLARTASRQDRNVCRKCAAVCAAADPPHKRVAAGSVSRKQPPSDMRVTENMRSRHRRACGGLRDIPPRSATLAQSLRGSATDEESSSYFETRIASRRPVIGGARATCWLAMTEEIIAAK